jgi:ABC-type branched-subunit amino acid transport system ATPase component
VSAMLEVEGACKRFGGVVAVDDLSFAVERGSFTSIIGPNGAGKTSALNLITGAYTLDRGDVRIGGRSIRGRSLAAISRAGVARTFQTLQIFGAMTARENVLVPIEARARAADARTRADGLLSAVGLAECADLSAETLSFGQQRLLELARALAAQPDVLLLDEPTSGLSRAEVAKFIEVLQSVRAGGVTLVMIEHDVRTVMAVSDQVIVMHRGAKLAAGAPAVVQSDPAVIEAYLGARRRRSPPNVHRPRRARRFCRLWGCVRIAVPCARSTASISRCVPAKSWQSSGRTAPGSRRCSVRSPVGFHRATAACGSAHAM